MHTQIDLRGNIPSFIHVSDGKMHEVNVLDLMTPEPGSFSIMNRGFLDFARLYRLTQSGAFFVIRPKSNTAFQRVYSRSVDKTTGLRCDQTVRLTGVTSANDHPQYLRYVVFCDEENDKRLGFFTNNFELPALTIAQLYKCRWQVELFFKWIKQHLRIKAFFGTNENAVKTQIWIAISVYVHVAIVKKRLGVAASLYTILQILSLTLFEKTPLDQLLNDAALQNLDPVDSNQLNFFSFSSPPLLSFSSAARPLADVFSVRLPCCVCRFFWRSVGYPCVGQHLTEECPRLSPSDLRTTLPDLRALASASQPTSRGIASIRRRSAASLFAHRRARYRFKQRTRRPRRDAKRPRTSRA